MISTLVEGFIVFKILTPPVLLGREVERREIRATFETIIWFIIAENFGFSDTGYSDSFSVPKMTFLY